MNNPSPSPRARDLGVPFEGRPGPLNAITDVPGVEVGHVTLIRGNGPLRVGSGPVRTGVTAIHPRGRAGRQPVFAGWFCLNGNGEIVIATDAPLMPHQLKALAKRGSLGMARTGGVAALTSGDLMLAFSTANAGAVHRPHATTATLVGTDNLTPLFEAAVQAAEEAIINALVAARPMTGINDYTVDSLPHDRLREVLRKYNCLEERVARRY